MKLGLAIGGLALALLVLMVGLHIWQQDREFRQRDDAAMRHLNSNGGILP